MIAASLGVVVPIVAGIAVLVAGLAFLASRIAHGRRAAIAALDELRGDHPALRIDGKALFFGVHSVGKLQARGNGVLALLEHELVFTRLVPAKTYRVALRDIVAVSHPRWFLGKSYGRKLLQIDWVHDGEKDSIAWFVPDLDGWRTALAAAGVATDAAANHP